MARTPLFRFLCLGVLLSLLSPLSSSCASAAEPAPPGQAAAPAPKQPRKVITLCGERLELMTRDEALALGFPWTDVPDDQNAATYYMQGANLLYELPKPSDADQKRLDDQRQYALDYGWQDSLKELSARIDAAQPALALYRKGSAFKFHQGQYNVAVPIYVMMLPELPKARDGAQLFTAEAARFEARKQFSSAVDNYLTSLRIGLHVGSDHTIVNHLVGIAIEAVALHGALYGIFREPYPRAELVRFAAELQRLPATAPDFSRAMTGEKAFAVTMIDQSIPQGRKGISFLTWPYQLPGMMFPNRALTPLEERAFRILLPERTLESEIGRVVFDEPIANAKRPIYEIPHSLDSDSDVELATRVKPWFRPMLIIVPAVTRVRVETEKLRANLLMLRTAIALKLYHADHGSYPAALDPLVKEKYLAALPIDPLTGKPFIYKEGDGQFVLHAGGQPNPDTPPQPGLSYDADSYRFSFNSKLPEARPYVPKPAEQK